MTLHPRRGIFLRLTFLLNPLPKCVVMAALMILCFDSTIQANGVDTDSFLRDFEKQRGKINTYAAQFVQKKTLALFGDIKTSTGEVLYRAPQQMVWKYGAPDKTQMRIDKESVSFYFPELEQIEVYPLEKSAGASHFFFAFEASAEELKENFDISLGAAADPNVNRVELSPKSEPTAYQLQRITLYLRKPDYLPVRIEIQEISGDTTEIELSEIRVNEPVTDDELKFDAPEGTEIIEAGPGVF